ncbi:MAG: M23 family metallopeptidase [Persicimonas sp.]
MAPNCTQRTTTTAALLIVCGFLITSCAGAERAPVCMWGASLDARAECRAQQAPVHHIPFRAGFKTKVMQSFHGYKSHDEDMAYAIDFRCPEGTPITASKAGRVWAVREDSNKGCADASCIDDANYVILDHGDGTYSEYFHLSQYGALVEPGDKVCAGEAIGVCGDTGFADGAHLHYGLTDATRQTVPVRMEEADRDGFGFVVPHTEYTSENELQAQCRDTGFSKLAAGGFSHQGIVLREDLPTVVTDPDETFAIEGTYHGDQPRVAVHRKPVGDDGADWIDECIEVDDKGRFSANLKWPRERFEPDTYWFMITGADDKCRSPGWAWSYKVQVWE